MEPDHLKAVVAPSFLTLSRKKRAKLVAEILRLYRGMAGLFPHEYAPVVEP